MMPLLRRATTAAATVAIASAAVLSSGGAAHAATTPPWEPDPSSVGALVFYDASGNVITGGNINDTPLAAYVQGATTIRTGDTKATLYGYLPVLGEVPGEWQGEQMSASTSYPNGSAPSPVSSTLPVVTGAADDESIATLEADFPNLDTSGDGYAGMYQLRLKTTAPNMPANTTYESADIMITGSTWSVVYSKTPTTTALVVAPTKPVFGDKVTLTAVVTPAEAGSVEFLDGSTVLKTVAVSGGIASYSTTKLAGGKHQLSATFVPSSSSSVSGSTSAVTTLKIKAESTKTTLKASKTTIKKGKKLTLTAKEKPSLAGKVNFYDGSKKLAAVKVKNGKAKYSTTKLKTGTHKLKAKFVPKDSKDATSSTSKVVEVTVKK
jgi:hypothetical protein